MGLGHHVILLELGHDSGRAEVESLAGSPDGIEFRPSIREDYPSTG